MPLEKRKKKSSQEKNGFYFFMQHFRKTMEAEGRRFSNNSELSQAAGVQWSMMTTAEKFPYEEQARLAKVRSGSNLNHKYTTTGISYAQLEREADERRERERLMLQEIEQTVRTQDVLSALLRFPFYFVHVNYYCSKEGTYFPCEIGVAKFTLRKGIDDSFHSLIEIEGIPMGYQYEAIKNSDETHGIPLPPQLLGGEKDYYKLLMKVRSLLLDGHSGDSLPPLYTLPTHIEPVVNVLDFLQNSSGAPVSADFRVYPLTVLFYELRNACARHAGTDGFPVLSLAERELDKDVFNFTPGISCQFHDMKDSAQYCSLSIVKRWCFLISDHCCQDVGVALIPGSHVPLFCDIARNCALMRDIEEKEAGAHGGGNSAGRGATAASKTPRPITIIDHSKLPPEQKAKHYNVSSAGEISSRSRSTATTPLRQPKTMSRAVAGFKTEAQFNADDFPALGAQGGVYGRLPVAVAGRGRARPQGKLPECTVPSVGRGRGLVNSLASMKI
ncbi:protein maelstrom homolog [Anabrus simplex]|uniref:protein maelstrom homolog n=1 Tax=Anabrus simplex TaxID=316456 RepID=UPI0034DDB8F6